MNANDIYKPIVTVTDVLAAHRVAAESDKLYKMRNSETERAFEAYRADRIAQKQSTFNGNKEDLPTYQAYIDAQNREVAAKTARDAQACYYGRLMWVLGCQWKRHIHEILAKHADELTGAPMWYRNTAKKVAKIFCSEGYDAHIDDYGHVQCPEFHITLSGAYGYLDIDVTDPNDPRTGWNDNIYYPRISEDIKLYVGDYVSGAIDYNKEYAFRAIEANYNNDDPVYSADIYAVQSIASRYADATEQVKAIKAECDERCKAVTAEFEAFGLTF